MPSDDRMQQALRVLDGAQERFRSAVTAAVSEVDAFLDAHALPQTNGVGGRAAAELGPFASGRIDAGRFGALFGGGTTFDPATIETVRLARAVLAETAAADDALFTASVAAGGDLTATAVAVLARAGRAFGASHVVELVRSGRFRAEQHDTFLEVYPPERWNRGERDVAPPLLLEVDGADLHACSLAELLQGRQQVVLVVRGACPPAPLVRAISPGVLVMQVKEPASLAPLAAAEGPGVAALVPEAAALFVHAPEAGPTLKDRLQVETLPEAPRTPLRRYSVFQQQQELLQLATLADAAHAAELAGPAAAGAGAAAEGFTTADKLAAWLLQHANLPDVA